MKFTKSLTSVLGASIAVALAAQASAMEFRSAEIHPDDYPTTLAVKHMSDTLKKLTNGKHSITVFSGGK